jgi:hypothetical protein
MQILKYWMPEYVKVFLCSFCVGVIIAVGAMYGCLSAWMAGGWQLDMVLPADSPVYDGCYFDFLIYVPFMQSFFGTTALGVEDWTFLASLALIVVFAEEVRNFFSRRLIKSPKN